MPRTLTTTQGSQSRSYGIRRRVHFKCNIRRIVDYPNLYGYLRELYQHEGIAEMVNFDHIKRHYYVTHKEINPSGIVPVGPELDLDSPHGRDTL